MSEPFAAARDGKAICLALVLRAVLLFATGCGTTRLTDTQRTATEQLLVSNAIDQAVGEFDFSPLSGKSVFFDPQYLDGTVDRGYLVSSIRNQLLASGCLLQEDRSKATYVVEVRSGGIGTDRHAILVGVPQMNVPAFVPGQPSQIPEIPFAKKTDQEAVAKVVVFAYNRSSGQIIWQSGVAQAKSTSKDTWLFGAGPFQRGTIHDGTRFAGEQLPLPKFIDKQAEDPTLAMTVPVTQPATWREPSLPKSDTQRLAEVLGTGSRDTPMTLQDAQQSLRALTAGLPTTVGLDAGKNSLSQIQAPASKPVPTNPAPAPPAPAGDKAPAANAGGQAETEPFRILGSGLGGKLEPGQAETEPHSVLESAGFERPGS